MPKRLKINNHTPKSPFFEALKDLHAFQFLVWMAKIDNPAITLKDLGAKYHISEQTAFRYVHSVEEQIKPYILEQAESGLKQLIPLWLIKVKERIEEGSDWVISDFGKWIGIKERIEIEDKRSPEEFKKDLVTNTSRLLGSRLDMTEPIGYVVQGNAFKFEPDPDINGKIYFPKNAIEPQGEEIKAEPKQEEKPNLEALNKPIMELKEGISILDEAEIVTPEPSGEVNLEEKPAFDKPKSEKGDI